MLSGEVGLRFRGLGDQFARPPALLESVRRSGVGRAAARSAVDWGRGVWGTPKTVAARLGAQLAIPVRVVANWRAGGHRAARAELQTSLVGERDRAVTSLTGAADLSNRLLRFTAIGPALLVADARANGVQATLEQHTYDAVQLAPDVLLGGAARLRHVAALEKAADARWVASAPNAAQGARLAELYAGLEAWDRPHRLIAGPGAAPFRNAADLAADFGGTADDYAKWATPKFTTADGRIMETHWVEDLRTGAIIEWKHKTQGWVTHAPRK